MKKIGIILIVILLLSSTFVAAGFLDSITGAAFSFSRIFSSKKIVTPIVATANTNEDSDSSFGGSTSTTTSTQYNFPDFDVNTCIKVTQNQLINEGIMSNTQDHHSGSEICLLINPDYSCFSAEWRLQKVYYNNFDQYNDPNAKIQLETYQTIDNCATIYMMQTGVYDSTTYTEPMAGGWKSIPYFDQVVCCK